MVLGLETSTAAEATFERTDPPLVEALTLDDVPFRPFDVFLARTITLYVVPGDKDVSVVDALALFVVENDVHVLPLSRLYSHRSQDVFADAERTRLLYVGLDRRALTLGSVVSNETVFDSPTTSL